MQVRHAERQSGPAGARNHGAVRGSLEAEVEAIDALDGERAPDEQAVPVLRPPRPPAHDFVLPRAGGREQAILLRRVHHLLQAEQVRLERRHVREQERQPLVPPIEDSSQVQCRDE